MRCLLLLRLMLWLLGAAVGAVVAVAVFWAETQR
jgi:hypothetical protein